MSDARVWTAKAKAGDPEALEWASSLFELGTPCWLCDSPTVEGSSISTIPDGADLRMAILTPICKDCFTLPQPIRLKREMNVLRRLWPKQKWNGWR
jgi:hypothetical protein